MMQRVLFTLLFCQSFFAVANDTVLKLYRPFGESNEQAIPVIKNTLTGHCLQQSALIVREDAWRCEAEGKTYDPCFVKAGNNRTDALCPQSPWMGDSVQITVSSPLNNEQNQTLDMSQAYPWAIELANGERCLATNSQQFYESMPVRYHCTYGNLLLGHIQRCKTVWSMLQKTAAGVETAELSKVWF